MQTTAPATIVAGPTPRETSLIVTFSLDAPLALVTIESPDTDRLEPAAYVALVEETATRLTLYAHDFRAAMQAEAHCAFAGA